MNTTIARPSSRGPCPWLNQALGFLFILLVTAGCATTGPGGPTAEALPVQAAQPTRPDWIDREMPDEGGLHFLVGLSEVHASERQAREDAMRHARDQFAQYTGVEVSLIDEVVRSLYGSTSGVLDATVAENATAVHGSEALVSRIKARQWYWERYRTSVAGQPDANAYRYWVLVSVPIDEYDRVQDWKRQRAQAQKDGEMAKAAELRQGLEAMAARQVGRPEPEPETIVVAPLKVVPAVETLARQAGRDLQLAATAQALAGRLLGELQQARAFQVLEPPATARYRLLVEIDGFDDASETVEYKKIGRTSLTRRVNLSAVLRITDLASGALVAEAPGGRLSRTTTVDLGRPGAARPGDEILVDLASDMAHKLVGEAVGTLRPARVLAMNGAQILIDRGSEDGFTAGATVELYAAEIVSGPASGALYRNELAVGRARIVRSEPRQCFAVGDTALPGEAQGLIVRLLAPATGHPVATGLPAPPVASGPDDKNWTTPGSSDKPVKW